MLFDTAGPQARARVAPGSWSKSRAIGPERASPRRAGRNRGPTDTAPSGPGQLVETADPRALAQATQDHKLNSRTLGHEPESSEMAGHPQRPTTQALDARESYSTPRALGHSPESPGTAG